MEKTIALVVEPESVYLPYIESILLQQGFHFNPKKHWFANTKMLHLAVQRNSQLTASYAGNTYFNPDDVALVVAEIENPVAMIKARTPLQSSIDMLINASNTLQERRQYVIEMQMLQEVYKSIANLDDSLDHLPADIRILIFSNLFNSKKYENNPWLNVEANAYLGNKIPRFVHVPKDYRGSELLALDMLLDAVRPHTLIEPEEL